MGHWLRRGLRVVSYQEAMNPGSNVEAVENMVAGLKLKKFIKKNAQMLKGEIARLWRVEESLDYNNGGFLSTFTLPVSADDDDSSGQFKVWDISLVHKVSLYNPEAVEGIDLSSFVDDDSLTVEDIHTMAADHKKFEPDSEELLGTQLVRAYQYAKGKGCS